MHRRTVHAAAVAASALLVAATGTVAATAASAPVKPFHNNLIVAQRSIGGFALGQTPATGRKGFPKADCHAGGCYYVGAGYTFAVDWDTTKSSPKKAVVDFIGLEASTGADAAKRVRTSSGIGLGSPYAAAKRGLAHAKFYGNKQSGYFLIGSGKVGARNTYVQLSKGSVYDIQIGDSDHVG